MELFPSLLLTYPKIAKETIMHLMIETTVHPVMVTKTAYLPIMTMEMTTTTHLIMAMATTTTITFLVAMM